MTIEVNKTYKFRITVGRELLNFTGEILEVNNNFVTFKDKYGDVVSYNLNSIVEYKELRR